MINYRLIEFNFNFKFTGHLGNPIACCSIKLIDVPELNIWTKNAQMGEVSDD